jgi:hypothetical protein
MQSNRFLAGLRQTALLLLVALCCSSFSLLHPYYISMTEIRMDMTKKTVSTSCRMFTDDLQHALTTLYHQPVKLQQPDTLTSRLLQQYIGARLKVSIGGKPVSFRLIGYEQEEEATWCYLETTPFVAGTTVQITNALLYDFLPAQTNFMHCYRNTERKSQKLANPETVATFSF